MTEPLTYGYDRNGNRTTTGHPEGITATYTHDFADREETLSLQAGANPPFQLVNAAGYEPFGPLSSLLLGNGLTETRGALTDTYAYLAILNPLGGRSGNETFRAISCRSMGSALSGRLGPIPL